MAKKKSRLLFGKSQMRCFFPVCGVGVMLCQIGGPQNPGEGYLPCWEVPKGLFQRHPGMQERFRREAEPTSGTQNLEKQRFSPPKNLVFR